VDEVALRLQRVAHAQDGKELREHEFAAAEPQVVNVLWDRALLAG
jgi:hypothetical protein